MNIFYAPPDQISGKIIEINGQEAHHAANVLRFKKGDEIVVVDGIGNIYTGIIDFISRKQITIIIQKKETKSDDSSRTLILALGIIKNRQRLEFAVEKAVELGASEIVLFESDHTEQSKVKIERLESIMISAMKQSMHARLPSLSQQNSVEAVLNNFPEFEPLIAHEKFDGKPGLPNFNNSNNVLLLVGPEGGFSEEEVKLVQKRGGEIVSLGKYRLRAETAALVFLSLFIDK